MIRIKHAAFMLLSCCIASDYASAHARSESYSHWHITETAMTGTITTPLREVMTLYQVEDSEISPKQLLLVTWKAQFMHSLNNHVGRCSRARYAC